MYVLMQHLQWFIVLHKSDYRHRQYSWQAIILPVFCLFLTLAIALESSKNSRTLPSALKKSHVFP